LPPPTYLLRQHAKRVGADAQQRHAEPLSIDSTGYGNGRNVVDPVMVVAAARLVP